MQLFVGKLQYPPGQVHQNVASFGTVSTPRTNLSDLESKHQTLRVTMKYFSLVGYLALVVLFLSVYVSSSDSEITTRTGEVDYVRVLYCTS